MRKILSMPMVGLAALALAACSASSNEPAASETAGGEQLATNTGCDAGEHKSPEKKKNTSDHD